MKEKYDLNMQEQERRSGGDGNNGTGWRFRNDPRQLERDDEIERSWFSDEEESEKKTTSGLVDYDNSDSDPETGSDKDKPEVTPIGQTQTASSEPEVKQEAEVKEEPEMTPQIGEKRENCDSDNNLDNPKRAKITQDETEPEVKEEQEADTGSTAESKPEVKSEEETKPEMAVDESSSVKVEPEVTDESSMPLDESLD